METHMRWCKNCNLGWSPRDTDSFLHCPKCGGDTTLEPIRETATKNDDGKLDWDLMPWGPLEEVVRALMTGVARGRFWWQKGKVDPDLRLRYKNALTRHVVRYLRGERKDDQTGIHPLAHAVANCLFLMWYDK